MQNFKYKEYLVGGFVRDELLGLPSKDKDYSFVFEDTKQFISAEEAFLEMEKIIKEKGEIFLSTPDCYTIRYKEFLTKEIKDVVLARKEIGYEPGTRKPIVVPGTLLDDLTRRDFTINAIAKDPITGTLIDPFNGQGDLKIKTLRTPINGQITFEDDPLRLLRALRFAVTKGFYISPEIHQILWDFDYDSKFNVVSEERIREELYKCFRSDTLATLKMLYKYYRLKEYIFKTTKLWLKPTNEL